MEIMNLEYFANKEPHGMKRFFGIFLALLIAFSVCACALAEENLVVNGDFSIIDANGMPEGWRREMWFTDAGVSNLHMDENGYAGSCITVVNADENDARFAQTIAVEPNTIYRASCMVKVENCGESGHGATLSFEDTFSYSDSIRDTAGEWQYLEVYGRTGKKQDEITLFCRIGGYGMLGTGRAWFDDVQLVEVEHAPAGAQVLSLATHEPSSAADSQEEEGVPPRSTETYLLMAFLYGVLMLCIARRKRRICESRVNAGMLLGVGLGIAVLLRMVLSMAVRGYNTDINCFSAWSERMYNLGPAGFYAEDYFCDYPPGYMLMLWIPAAIRNLLGLAVQGKAHLLLLKLFPILFDLLGAGLIWRTAKKHDVHPAWGAVLALIYAFNPAVIIDSAAWGQIDSIFTLLIAICAMKAADEKYIPSLIAFAAAMLIKPQALLFGPLGLIAILIFLIRGRNGRKAREFLIGAACALALIYLTAFIFCLGRADGFIEALILPVEWIIAQYGATLGSYSYLTINALNLYTLLGYNWTATSAQPLWTIFAYGMMGLSYAYAAFLCLKSKEKRHLVLSGGTLMVLIFVFGPKIHERYIYPALLLLALCCAMEKDRRIFACLGLFTITTAMNELLVLQGGMGSGNYGHLQSSEQWLNAILSLMNIIGALYMIWVSADICIGGNNVPLKKGKLPEKLPLSGDHRMHLRSRDYALMAAVTLVYAAFAFVNLGAAEAPQTTWVSSQSGESIVFDLGAKEDFRLTYYGGICNSTFTVELSNDGKTWTDPYYANYKQGEIFRWLWYVPLDSELATVYGETLDSGDGSAAVHFASAEQPHPLQSARYVRITAQSAGLRLSEVGFMREDGSIIDANILSRSGEFAEYAADPHLLLDEQHTIADHPSYYNGTYFDEIYHARTAYEMLHGETVYEWTHPPLGKVMMMIGIQIFGMTPFGWRFMGALIGVMMLPLMYLLAKQLTKSSKLSFIAMMLMALDSMHFTQTRIATIDSYAVFWIMLMYLFMIRYIQMDWRKVSIGRSFVPLGLCGVTMGVAIATKWIGCYAAVGLAILLFWKLIADLISAKEDRGACWKRFWLTVLFCIGFFVVIPVLIYYFSHFWQLRYEGVATIGDMFEKRWIERVVTLQESMLSYHAGLGGDTHYFRSEWYEWPVIWWPMWYYSGNAFMPEGVISSISCMGNPAVWWSGLIALIFVLSGGAYRRRTPAAWLIVLIGFASQFLPWVLVPRSTFIYHYFASVPFIILCTVLALDFIRKRDAKAFKAASIALIAAALVLFIAFYPLESGMPVSRDYAQYLRWFKWYNF